MSAHDAAGHSPDATASAGRRPPGRRWALAMLALAVIAALAATWFLNRPRGLPAAAAPEAHDPLCGVVADRWPADVGGHERVAVRDDPPAVAAWGDPAIIARCGATSPGPTTDDCVAADGVDWVGRRVEGGMVFVTYGRAPAVEVLVPSDYAPEPLVLGAFADAASAIRQGPHRCR